MIEIRHLRIVYPEATPLTDVNADIHEGDVIAVIGPSGTGKSTLLRCINLLETPTSGSILIDGEEILSPSFDAARLRRKVGMVFQSFNLFGHLTAIENIMRPQMDLLGRSKQEAYDRSIVLLKRVGLSGAALRYPDELSGGQQQRIAIARTVALDPDVILFDEPTSALDPTMIGEVQAVIRDLALTGKTLLIVTHEMSFARAVANRVFYMDEGVIYEDGTAEEIFDRPSRERTRRFIRKIRVLEILIREKDPDFPRSCGQIDDYCKRHHIPHSTALRILTVFEELVQQILMPGLSEPDLLFTAEYSEAQECAEVIVEYKGKPFVPETCENTLSLAVLQNAVTDIRCEVLQEEERNCRIFLQIKKNTKTLQMEKDK